MLRVYLERKYILPFRMVMLLATVPFLINMYDAINTGIAFSGRYYVEAYTSGFYVYLLKQGAFLLLFLWLGTFGVSKKEGK